MLTRAGIALAAAVLAMVQPAAAHWCDSVKRPTEVERAICSDSRLIEKDMELNRLYAALGGKESASVKAAQRQWMTGRNLCRTMDCLHGYYDDRLRKLTKLNVSRETVPPPRPSLVAAPARPAGSILVGQFTIGGCVSVCEALAVCDDAYPDEENGDCWLALDKTHPDFVTFGKSCPRTDGQEFSAEMADGEWHLTCASPAAAATEDATEPEESAIDDLPDIEPF